MLHPSSATRTFAWLDSPGDADQRAAHWVRRHLLESGWEQIGTASDKPAVVIVWQSEPLHESTQRLILEFAALGSRILLGGPTLTALEPGSELAESHGLIAGDVTMPHAVRIRPLRADTSSVIELYPAQTLLSFEAILTMDKVADDVDVLLTANVTLTDHPVATFRPATGIGTFSLVGPTLSPAQVDARREERDFLRLLLITLTRMVESAQRPPPRPVQVGLLGFGTIGVEHAQALHATPGLSLRAVCDRSATRLAEAERAAPHVLAIEEATDLLADPDLDLVVISTPPDSHTDWALQALAADKHVVVEKPLTLTSAEADDVLTAASDRSLLAVTYQNRRFDPDYLAIRRAVRQGRIGSIFHVETFVGGYGHPCNFWHSDAGVSGGAIFDWGAHVLDQLLDLLPGEIDYVTAAEHKLVWHDVSNADHSRVTIRFCDGAEVEFIHSDAAAASKPRWYILGSEGAIVGHWRAASVVSRNEIGTLSEDVLAPADSPPILSLHAADGSTSQLAAPSGQTFGFHQELSDYLNLGLPMSVAGRDSRRVVAVMEAARTSAASNGRQVALS